MAYYVYILESEQYGKFYVGQTNDWKDRIKRHNEGMENYTAPFRPWKLRLLIQKDTRSEAMALERKLKNLNKERLAAFIQKYA